MTTVVPVGSAISDHLNLKHLVLRLVVPSVNNGLMQCCRLELQSSQSDNLMDSLFLIMSLKMFLCASMLPMQAHTKFFVFIAGISGPNLSTDLQSHSFSSFSDPSMSAISSPTFPGMVCSIARDIFPGCFLSSVDPSPHHLHLLIMPTYPWHFDD
ncbi:hypothetical protein V6N11_002049 [Hibiscus sabdariffa]|uniref:Uncharacterized protein n=1 Tax=Hibiscus sabdariffa TaxID=183260 RepID=A0ABR2QU35_9ROSI